MSNSKKYIITSLTLCAIGAVSALAIAGTNLITKDRIETNAKKAQEVALKEIFSDAKFSEAKTDFKLDNHSYLVNYYIASDSSDNELGYVYFVDGRNAYGEISLMVGVTNSGVGQISVVTNTQSFASTLKENYIDPYKAGKGDLDDVSCGATYGAKLIKAMTDEASSDYKIQKGGN